MASIEQTLSETHAQQRKLLDFFQNKQNEWDKRVANKETQLDKAIADIPRERHLPNNLIPNMFFTDYLSVAGEPSYDDPKRPRKYPKQGLKAAYGRAVAELVSPFNFGFEGLQGHRYHSEWAAKNPDKITTDPRLASLSRVLAKTTEGGYTYHPARRVDTISGWSPFFTVNRWAGLRKEYGHLLRVTVPAFAEGENSKHSWVNTEATPIYANYGTLDFRCWLYVRKGGVAIGDHAGYNNRYGGIKKYDESDFTDGVSPWRHVRVISPSYRSAHASFRRICFGADPKRDTEYFIALPYLAVIDSRDEAVVGNYGVYHHD